MNTSLFAYEICITQDSVQNCVNCRQKPTAGITAIAGAFDRLLPQFCEEISQNAASILQNGDIVKLTLFVSNPHLTMRLGSNRSELHIQHFVEKITPSTQKLWGSIAELGKSAWYIEAVMEIVAEIRRRASLN